MAGLGDYTKGKKFTLKSGNSPAFKMMGNIEAGDSPITKDFGIGKGTSPYQMSAKSWKKNEEMREEVDAAAAPKYKSPYLEEESATATETETETETETKTETETAAQKEERLKKEVAEQAIADKKAKRKAGWKKAAQIGLATVTGGLDAVYGSGKIMPLGSARLGGDGDETEALTLAQKIIADSKGNKTT